MNAIALTELRMLIRNRLVALCAIAVPLVAGILLVWRADDIAGGAAAIAALQLVVMASMGLYVTATTTLSARRQTLMLKRLRSGTASDPAVLTGLLVPLVLVNVVQIVAVLIALAASTTAPGNIALVDVAVIVAEVMLTGFALATAGVTTSPEHAQFTTLPVFLVVSGAGLWVAVTGLHDLFWVKLLIPGGAIAHLVTAGWGGVASGDVALAAGAALAWALVAGAVAWRMFRWEPRR